VSIRSTAAAAAAFLGEGHEQPSLRFAAILGGGDHQTFRDLVGQR